MTDLMNIGLTLDPSGIQSGGTVSERILERIEKATEATEVAISRLVDKMLTTPGAAKQVEDALNRVEGAEKRVETASQRMIRGMSDAGTAQSRVSAEAAKYGITLGGASVGQEKLASSGGRAGDAMAIVGRRVADTAGHMLGLSNRTSNAIEQLLHIGVGGVATLAISAGLLVIIALIDKMTEALQKDKKATDELMKSLKSAGETRLKTEHPEFAFDEDYRLLSERRKKIQEKLDNENQHQDAVRKMYNIPDGASLGGDADSRLAKLKKDLHEVNMDLREVGKSQDEAWGNLPAQQNKKYFDELSQALQVQHSMLGRSATDTAIYALQFDEKLTPAQRRYLAGLMRIIDVQTRVRAAMLESYMPGSNRVPGDARSKGDLGSNDIPDGTNYSPNLPGFLRGNGNANDAALQKAKEFNARQAAQAARYIAIWKSAEDKVQDSIAKVFEDLGGDPLNAFKDFAKSVVNVWRDMLAEMAAESLRKGIAKLFGDLIGFVVKRAGNADANKALDDAGKTDGIFDGGGGNALASVSRRPGTTMVVHQNITFSASAIDARGVQELLVGQRGTIAAIVAQAANDSRSFRQQLGGR